MSSTSVLMDKRDTLTTESIYNRIGREPAYVNSLARDRKSKPKWCTESTLCKCTGLFLVAGCIAGIIVWFAVFNGSTIGNSNGGSDSNNPNIPGTDTYDQTCADVSADKCARLQLEGNTLEEALEATSMSKETRHQEHIAVHYEKVNDTDLARYVVDIALHPQDTDSCCERDEITGRNLRSRNEIKGDSHSRYPVKVSKQYADKMIRYTFKLKVLPLDTRGVMTHLFQIFNSKPDLVVTITSNNELYFHSPEGVFSNIRIYDTGEWMDQWISFAITIQYSTNYIHLQAGKNGSNVIDTEPAILKPMSVENYYRLKYGLYYVADLVGPPTTFHVRYVDVQVEEVQSQANETVGNGTDIGTNTSTGVEETGVDVVSSQATDVGSLPIDTSSENDDDPLIDVDEIDI